MSDANAHFGEGLQTRSKLTYLGLFFTTMSGLMYEIVLTRIFSVTMWYHFAFVAISVALFGLTAGALLVHLRPERFSDELAQKNLAKFSLLYAIAIPIAFLIQLAVPVIPDFTVSGLTSVSLVCFVIAIPFVLQGIVVCIALTKFPREVNRLYAADLVGAGLGCVAVIFVFKLLDGPSVVVFTGAIAALGALMFSLDTDKLSKVAAVAVVIMMIVSGTNAALSRDSNAFLKITWAKEQRDKQHDYERWNSYSRITVNGNPNAPQRPSGFGFSTTLPKSVRVNQLGMLIDSTAGTILTRYDGNPKNIGYLKYELTNLAHNVKPKGDVLVIGVGGGRDILSALAFGMNSVTGVEINSNILHATNGDYGDFTGHLDRIPGVKFENDEARSYLARTDSLYDIIQISLIDTWAATSAGAYALSENSLYSTDAWGVFFDSLKPGGILSVSRWYQIGDRTPVEVWRTVSLASKALQDRGVKDVRQHILVFKGPPQGPAGAIVANVLVSPDPFDAATIAALEAKAGELQFPTVLTPTYAISQRVADLASSDKYKSALNSFDEDISAPTDNKPFFFQMANLRTLFTVNYAGDTHLFEPVLVLVVLAFVVLIMAAICLAIPLLMGASHEGLRTNKAWRPYYRYFAGIGLGFLLVEVSQLQRLSIYLGHPTLALGVVLFSVLLFSGLGSMVVERLVDSQDPRTYLRPLGLLLAVILLFGLITPSLIHGTDSFTTPMRILIAILLIAPLGFLMGMPFSLGMRVAGATEIPTAFLWGINGATSVCASVLSVVVALFFGIFAAFFLGFFAYVLAFVSMRRIVAVPAGDQVDSLEPGSEPALAGA